MIHSQQPDRLVYLVDDNHADRKIIEFSLKEIAPDSHIKSFSNPEMISALQTDLPQIQAIPILVLVDMNLLPGTGLDLIRELRQTISTTDLQIVAMSGQAGMKIWKSAYQAGANMFWEKPMTLDQMLSELTGILNHAQRFPVLTEQMIA